jgi:hypothetical protein
VLKVQITISSPQRKPYFRLRTSQISKRDTSGACLGQRHPRLHSCWSSPSAHMRVRHDGRLESGH